MMLGLVLLAVFVAAVWLAALAGALDDVATYEPYPYGPERR